VIIQQVKMFTRPPTFPLSLPPDVRTRRVYLREAIKAMISPLALLRLVAFGGGREGSFV